MSNDSPQITGVEFAAFAAADASIWQQLQAIELTHSIFGEGKISSVTERENAPALLVIIFDKVGEKQFNAEAFAKGVFPKLSLPSSLIHIIVQWRQKIAADFVSAEKARLEASSILQAKLLEASSVLQARMRLEREQLDADAAALESFRELALKYKIPSEHIRLSPLLPILHKLESKEALDQANISWLEDNRLFNVLATYFHRCYLGRGDEWDLVKACRYFRRSGLPKMVLKLTHRALALEKPYPKKTKSAILTTRGGAYRDIGDLGSARTAAQEAVRLQESQYPHNLLGAICYAEGQPEAGDRHFDAATALGGSERARDEEIQSVLRESSIDIRAKIAEYLIQKDPEKYKWATRFMRPQEEA